MLTEGDFDERVFLCDEADEELGTPIKGQLSEIKRDLRKDVTQQYTMVCYFLYNVLIIMIVSDVRNRIQTNYFTE